MSVIVDEAMLREPNLWVPGEAPIGPVKIDWSNSLTNSLMVCIPFFSGVSLDLVNGDFWVLGSGVSYKILNGRRYFGGGQSDANNYIKSNKTNVELNMVNDFHLHAGIYVDTYVSAYGTVLAFNSTNYTDWVAVEAAPSNTQIRYAMNNNSFSGSGYTIGYHLLDVDGGSASLTPRHLWLDNILGVNTTGSDSSITEATISLSRSDDRTGTNNMMPGGWSHLYLFNRKLHESERLSLNYDPYQFLIPA